MFKEFFETIALNVKERTGLYLLLGLVLIAIVVARVIVRSLPEKTVSEVILPADQTEHPVGEEVWGK